MERRRDPGLWNEDLAPIPPSRRSWGIYNYASLWVAMSVCIPTYMLASGLIAGGMSWWQAIITILLGNLIVLVPMLLNAHAGTKYGIPFPVLVRASFGVRGANIPAVLRALVACGWFGIQTWIGGQAIYSMLQIIWPESTRMAGGIWICFFAFWALNIFVIWRGIETTKFLEGIGAPFMLGVGLLLLWWITSKAGGFGPVLSAPSKFRSSSEFFRFFVPSLTGMVGFWATVALNIPDFTRYAKSQKAQAIGQALGLPTAMTLYSFIGVAVTSASAVLFGEAIWDPVILLGKFRQPVVALFALVALLIATLNTNVAANVVSPSNDFSNLNPRLISFRTGGMITGVIGVLMMPWRLLTDFSSYIFGWLVGYSALLGPIAGVMIADYFVVRRAQLEVDDLYRREGLYAYSKGVNGRAVIALILGVAVAALGRIVPQLHLFYDYAWFVGFGVAGAIYVLLMDSACLRWCAIALLVLGAEARAFGQEVKWLLNGSFTTYAVSPYTCCAIPDSGTVSGYFVYDEQSNKVIAWDLITSGGNFTSFEYTPSNSSAVASPVFHQPVEFESNASFSNGFGQSENRFLELQSISAPTSPLPSTIGVVVPVNITECLNCSPYRTGTGTLFGVPVACPNFNVLPYPGLPASNDGHPISMNASFTPTDLNGNIMTLPAAGAACGFVSPWFNWQQTITNESALEGIQPLDMELAIGHGIQMANIAADGSLQAGPQAVPPSAPPYSDPPLGGYQYEGYFDDAYPFFWNAGDLNGTEPCVKDSAIPVVMVSTLNFQDCPGTIVLKEFTTSLVGVLPCSAGATNCGALGAPSVPLFWWKWQTTYDGTAAGGVTENKSTLPPGPGGGSGIATITNINGVQLPPVVPPGQGTTTASGLTYSPVSQTSSGTVTVTNTSGIPIGGPLQIVFFGLPPNVTLLNATGNLSGTPYLSVPGVLTLGPGQSITTSVQFANPSNVNITLTAIIYSGSIITVFSRCDLLFTGNTNVADVQLVVNEALGAATAVSDLNGDGIVNVVDVQLVINAALGLGCTGA